MSIRAVRPALALALGVVLAGCAGGGALETSSRSSSKDFLMGVPTEAQARSLPTISGYRAGPM